MNTDLANELNCLKEKNIELWIEGDTLKYRGPKSSISPQVISFLKAQKENIIRFIELQKRSQELNNISPVARDCSEYLCSFAEKGIFFLQYTFPKSSGYNIPFLMQIKGALNVGLLHQSFRCLIIKHEILRTSFELRNGDVYRFIHNPFEFDLRVIESDSPSFKKAYETSLESPFDLSQVPLIRGLLHKESDHTFTLGLVLHHMIADGWSMSLFISELMLTYQKLDQNKPIAAPSTQYIDYVYWERKCYESGLWQADMDYWTAVLKKKLVPIQLPEKLQSLSLSDEGSTHSWTMPKEALKKLSSICKKLKVSHFLFFLAIYKILLRRYSNENIITIGVPVANRNLQELESMLGFFSRTLVIRSEFKHNLRFLDFLSQLQETLTEAYSHQNVPLETLIEKGKIERKSSANPFFQTIMTYHNASQKAEPTQGLEFEPIKVKRKKVKFDFHIEVADYGKELEFTVEYKTKLYNHTTIKNLAIHFQHLIDTFLKDPSENIDSVLLPCIREATPPSSLVLHKEVSAPSKTLSQIFEDQVEKNKNKIAVTYEGKNLSYKELNEKADNLSQYLLSLGITHDEPIAIFLDRSVEMIIGIIGILKAGGAYVPIDTISPRDRIKCILEDCKSKIVISKPSLFSTLPQLDINLVDINKIPFQPKVSRTKKSYSPNQLAYIIYTSGSTGKPKGVMINHQSVVWLFASLKVKCEISNKDVWTLFHSYAFDFSVWEIWGALLHGGKLIILPYYICVNSPLLSKVLVDHKVTIFSQTPSSFTQFLTWVQSQSTPPKFLLRMIIFGGERLNTSKLRPWIKRYGLTNPKLINMYGITEITIHTTYHQLEDPPGDYTIHQQSQIGLPLAHSDVYILSENLEPVSDGVTGEIFIAGKGLAIGYLHSPTLTAERFVPNPYAKSPGERLYKSGDLGRYNSRGILEYVGRKDFQVKVRGYRIELEEIETRLIQSQNISQAVVRIWEDSSSNPQIIAYLVLENKSIAFSETLTQLKISTSKFLPPYMMPSKYVVVSEIPLTTNGKIDDEKLKVLEAPVSNEPLSKTSHAKEFKTIENQLLKIFKRALNNDNIQAMDNFFAVGGHSFLAMSIINELESNFSIKVSIQILFEANDIGSFIDEVKKQIKTPKKQDSLFLSKQKRFKNKPTVFPASFNQQQVFFLEQYETGINYVHVCSQIKHQYNPDLLKKALLILGTRHEILRTTFAYRGEVLQYVQEKPIFGFEYEDFSEQDFSDAQECSNQLLGKYLTNTYDLGKGPLYHLVYHRLSSNEGIIALFFHHIIVDYHSLKILGDELSSIYQYLEKGVSSDDILIKLRPIALQYGDFSVWQKNSLNPVRMSECVLYWKNQLKDALLEEPIVTDSPRNSIEGRLGKSFDISLSSKLMTSLRTNACNLQVTLQNLILSSFAIAFTEYSGKKSIVIGMPVSLRPHHKLENVIGNFVNVVPILININQQDDITKLLQEVKTTCANAYQYQDLPFPKLLDALNIERHSSYTPLFQITFNMNQNFSSMLASAENAKDLALPLVKYDLSLYVIEQTEAISISFVYDGNLFREETIKDLSNKTIDLLKKITNPQKAKVSELSGISLQQQKLLEEFISN